MNSNELIIIVQRIKYDIVTKLDKTKLIDQRKHSVYRHDNIKFMIHLKELLLILDKVNIRCHFQFIKNVVLTPIQS